MRRIADFNLERVPRLTNFKTMADYFDDGSTHGCCQSAFYIVLKLTSVFVVTHNYKK